MRQVEKRNAAPGAIGRGAKGVQDNAVSEYHSPSGKQPRRRDLLGDGSPLDRDMAFTFFPNKYAKRKWERTISLRQFADKVKQTSAQIKDDLPWFKCALFGSEKSKHGSLRHDANLEDFEAVEVDYDGGEVPIEDACAQFKEAGVAAVFYETASSTPQDHRWRGVFPCSKVMKPKERKALVARLNGVLKGVLAGESFNSSQAYYFGGVDGKPAPKVMELDGGFIDKAHHLDATAMGKRQKENEDHELNDDSGSGAAFRKAMELHLNGGTIEDFEEWAMDNPWGDSERNFDRAVKRAWKRAAIEAGKKALANSKLDFENIGSDSDSKPQALGIVMASEIEPKPIDWIWPSYIARGKGMLLTGLPDMGKSQITIKVAATISCGDKWPDGTKAPRGSILILSSEDAANDTIVPRIIAAQGDRRKIGFFQQTVGKSGKRRMITLKDDLGRMGAAIQQLGNVQLVIIDPITAYMGSGTDSHKAADVRAVLDGVSEWAQELGIAVLALTHPAKAVTSAMNSAVGSQAYVAFFRTAFLAGYHPEDAEKPNEEKRRVLSCIKINIGKRPSSIAYTIETAEVQRGIIAPYVEWGDKVQVEADQIISPGGTERKTSKAEKFLKAFWDFDPEALIPVSEIEEGANAQDIGWRTVESAKKSLGIKSKTKGGKWFWVLRS
jgi:putative DNA primase/helicase